MVGEEFGAVGIWFGTRSNGLVCLDIDGNLESFLEKHPSILDGAHIKSPKTDRAKVLFQVPEELWQDVKGYDNSRDTYQVLWEGKMGVCAGAYGAGGEYTFVPGEVPQAPDWLLEEMLAVKAKRGEVNLSSSDMRFDTVEQAVQKISDWLGVIPNEEGDWLGQEEPDAEGWWFRVGACIAGAGLGEEGLKLWREWSQRDERYNTEWQHSDPCDERWWTLSADGGLGPGTLCKLADQFDPDRLRLKPSVDPAKNDEKDQAKADNYDEFLRRAQEADKIPQKGKRNYLLHSLGMEYGYNRDPIAAVQDLLLDHLADTVKDRKPNPTKWLIPDVLTTGNVSCFYGDPSSGKSKVLLKFAQILCEGTPFMNRGKLVPVEPCRVLWLNNDQPRSDLERIAEDHGFDTGHENFRVVSHWDFSQKWELVRQIQEFRPSAVFIDSLSACSTCPNDENKAQFGADIQWLVMMNGYLWQDPVFFAPLHHTRKKGKGEKQGDGYRGHSSLEAKFQDMVSVKKDLEDDNPNKRLMVWQDKSRSGKAGDVIESIQDVHGDLHLQQLSKASDTATQAQSMAQAQLKLIQASGSGLTVQEMSQDKTLQRTYGVTSEKDIPRMLNLLKKNTHRFVEKGLVEQNGTQPNAPGVRGPRQKVWKAVISRAGKADKGFPYFQNPVVESDLKFGTSQNKFGNSHNSEDDLKIGTGIMGNPSTENEGVPYLFPSDTNGSRNLGNLTSTFREIGSLPPGFDSTGATD